MFLTKKNDKTIDKKTIHLEVQNDKTIDSKR